ncbi:MAG TPA: RbsD/FucU family protein [Abditibacteriaceae bacterium]|jgi:D-ribose pyranase
MVKSGLLNPHVLSLLARVRHTNAIVISDRGFPFWPMIETIDLSLVDNVPTVLQVVEALRQNHHFGASFMAEEFKRENSVEVQSEFETALHGIPLAHEPHEQFKKRVPGCIGLIRTGDTTQYANIILVSA